MGVPSPRAAVVTAYASRLIRYKARQLSRKPGFSPSDQDDLAQELTAALLAKAGRYDPARASPDTFADRVVESEAKMILRARRRLKRADGFRARSLDGDGRPPGGRREGTPLADTLTDEDRERRSGRAASPGPAEAADTSDAVRHALAALSPFDAEVARLLREMSPSAVAQELGVTRPRVAKAMDEIRRRLLDAELGGP